MSSRVLTIMFTDIKGYTERTSTHTRAFLRELLQRHEELMLPLFATCCGRVVKTIGDAFLVVFESPTNAVLCGLLIQETLRGYNERVSREDERIDVRVAINSGEVEVRDGDVFGEAVNIAARIEGITDAGEIYFTDAVYLAMNKSEVPTAEVGLRRLKGIPEEIKVYRVLRDPGSDQTADLLGRIRDRSLIAETDDPFLREADRARPAAEIPHVAVAQGRELADAVAGRRPAGRWQSALAAAAALAVLVAVGLWVLETMGLGIGRGARLSRALDQARSALEARDHGRALALLDGARDLDPGDDRLLDSTLEAVWGPIQAAADRGSYEQAVSEVARLRVERPYLASRLDERGGALELAWCEALMETDPREGLPRWVRLAGERPRDARVQARTAHWLRVRPSGHDPDMALDYYARAARLDAALVAGPEVLAFTLARLARLDPDGPAAEAGRALLADHLWDQARGPVETLHRDGEVRGRVNAHRLLLAKGLLDDRDVWNHQVRNLLGGDLVRAQEAAAYLDEMAAGGRLAALRQAAGPLVLDGAATLRRWGSQEAAAAREALRAHFLDEVEPTLVRWLTEALPAEAVGEDERSHNAYRILEEAGRLAGVDLHAYHLRNLRSDFDAYLYTWLEVSIAWAAALPRDDPAWTEAGEALLAVRVTAERLRADYLGLGYRGHVERAGEILGWVDAAEAARRKEDSP